jgi:DNA-binding transcriptional LysR family regulator
VLPNLLGEFRDRCPGINIRLSVSNSVGVVHMVENNSVDIGIVESPITNKNLVVEVCWHDELVFICPPSHPLASEKTIPVAKLVELPFICREEGSGTREFICDYLGQNKLHLDDLNLSMEMGSPEAVKSTVEAGLGVSIVSKATVGKEILLGTIKAIPLDPPLKRPFSIVHQRQKFRLSIMDQFMDFAHEHCEKQSSGKDQK